MKPDTLFKILCFAAITTFIYPMIVAIREGNVYQIVIMSFAIIAIIAQAFASEIARFITSPSRRKLSLDQYEICDLCNPDYRLIDVMIADNGYIFYIATDDSNIRVIDSTGHKWLVEFPIADEEPDEKDTQWLIWWGKVRFHVNQLKFDITTSHNFYTACKNLGYNPKINGGNIELWFMSYILKRYWTNKTKQKLP